MADAALMEYLVRQYAGSEARQASVTRLGFDPREAIIDFLVWADNLLEVDPPRAMGIIDGVPHLLFSDGRGIPVHSMQDVEPAQITSLLGQPERPAQPVLQPQPQLQPQAVPLGAKQAAPFSVSQQRAARPEDYYFPDVEGNDAEHSGKTEAVATFSMAGPPKPRRSRRF